MWNVGWSTEWYLEFKSDQFNCYLGWVLKKFGCNVEQALDGHKQNLNFLLDSSSFQMDTNYM